MNTSEFRNELTKIMPGYKWVIAKPYRFKTDTDPGIARMTATGIQSAGYNRVSTIRAKRDDGGSGGTVEYTVSIADYGARSPWLETVKAPTLARALRCLQDRCESMAGMYAACVRKMQAGRVAPVNQENSEIVVDNSTATSV